MSIKGENGMLYTYETSAWKPTACLTSIDLNSAVSIIESQTKCFPGVVKKTPGSFSATISAEGEYIDTTTAGGDTAKVSHDKMFLDQQLKTIKEWKIDTDITNAASVKYYGSGYYTDLSLTAGSGDEVSTFSVTLDVDGAVLYVDQNVLIPVITSLDEIAIDNGVSGTFQIVATNPPISSYAFTGAYLPPANVTVNSTTGLISWTSVVAVGVYPVTITVVNAGGSTSQNITITVTA